jgi:hypothetical protein
VFALRQATPNPSVEARHNGIASSMTPHLVHVGGVAKSALLAQLERAQVQMNEHAKALFAHSAFVTSQASSSIDVIELSVSDLGFSCPTTIASIHARAIELGHALCPLELGPYLRLQYLDQPEGSIGQLPSHGRAPPGSITVASAPISDDYAVPKGFYLRVIEDVLWLRGYRSDAEHAWAPEHRFVFQLAANAVTGSGTAS